MVSLNGTLLFQILNFVVLVVILAKFAYKPLLKTLEDRRNKIASDLDGAAKARKEAEQLKADYEAQIRDAQAQAQAIVDKAVKQADKQAQAQLDAIREQIQREKEIAQAEIANEREAAIREMRNEVVTLSMAVAEKLLKKNLDSDGNAALISDCIKQIHTRSAKGN
ncbi:F0F1 ATP synthase subunit B [uncultured Megasphaera sp.]|uniref:F0F1 ATP synthase subunit B n=1 Tax=uncultured Megasphaera sp. TaxID=165188 RepID=UPI00265AAF8E|nr:F0F1 ATP synthase subunit B [uncultured Megasphaera sp.]